MHFIDSHCHLNFSAFSSNYFDVVQSARDVGVKKVIIVGADPQTSTRALEIAREINLRFKNFAYCAVGIHPTHTDRIDFKTISRLATDPSVVAIGETGMDFHLDKEKTSLREQAELFAMHINLAQELNKPLIVHNREADDEVGQIVKDSGYFNGVFHCYSSDHHFSRMIIDLGFYISFTGNITYGNKKLKKVVERTNLEKIMIETDSPYIVPEPLRQQGQKQNEPAFVTHVAEKIAKIKNITLSEVAETTTKNTITCFNL